MKHPYRLYTLEDALMLARDLKYGPLPKPEDPTPSVAEAIELIDSAPAMRAFNWITGQTALQVLRAFPNPRKRQQDEQPESIPSPGGRRDRREGG